MDARQRLGVVLAAIIVGGASVGVSRTTAGTEWTAAMETLAADQKQAPPTSTRLARRHPPRSATT
jgi:hypothetical protein